jgi:hypothetical protein
MGGIDQSAEIAVGPPAQGFFRGRGGRWRRGLQTSILDPTATLPR